MKRVVLALTSTGELEPAAPSPDQFDRFLPWACRQLGLYTPVLVARLQQDEHAGRTLESNKSLSRRARSKRSLAASDASSVEERQFSAAAVASAADVGSRVNIVAVYDADDRLVQIKFCNNKTIPPMVIKIIDLILKFHPYACALSLDGGADARALREACACAARPGARLADLCLDGCRLAGAAPLLPLAAPSALRTLSLSRCSLGDADVRCIAEALAHPLPASGTLVALNLSANMVTDAGAGHLAAALRSNRRLAYLNLASNALTDDGVGAILGCLLAFPLTAEEALDMRRIKVQFYRERVALIEETAAELKAADCDKKVVKKKPAKGSRGPEREGSARSAPAPAPAPAPARAGSVAALDALYYKRAEEAVERAQGRFEHPFGAEEAARRRCAGNNALAYLNIAYNSVGVPTLGALVRVLRHQRALARRPPGLVNVRLEGNSLPAACEELARIEELLDAALAALVPAPAPAPAPGKPSARRATRIPKPK